MKKRVLVGRFSGVRNGKLASSVGDCSRKQDFRLSKGDWALEALEPKVLMSADLVPGVHTIEGSIEQPGERDVFEFVVEGASKRFYFDGAEGSSINWTLSGPTAASSFSSRALTDTGDKSLILPVGSYKLTVDGNDDITGSYSFRLIGEEAAVPLTPNTSISGTLEAGRQAHLYRVDLSAGDRLYFQSTSVAGGGAVWSLFDPQGGLVHNRLNLNSDNGPFVAANTGTYWLSVEGSGSLSAATSYAFSLWRQPAAPVGTLVLNEPLVAKLEVPGAAQDYRFHLDQLALLAWDQLSAKRDSGIRWSVMRADGSVIATNTLATEDGSTNPMRLLAGDYVLRIESTGRSSGDVAFRLLRPELLGIADGVMEVPATEDSTRNGLAYRIDVDGPAGVSIVNLTAPQTAEPGRTLDTATEQQLALDSSVSLPIVLAATPEGWADVDLYRTFLAVGETLDLAASNASAGVCLRLFDATGAEVARSVDGVLRYVAGTSGLLYVGVSHELNAGYSILKDAAQPQVSAPDCTLALTMLRIAAPADGAATSPDSSDDAVGDTLATAQEIRLAAGDTERVQVTLGDGTMGGQDVDMYRVVLAAGESLEMKITEANIFAYARIFGASGSLWGTQLDSVPRSFTANEAGVYYVGVSGLWNTNYRPDAARTGNTGSTGSFELSFSRKAVSATATDSTWKLTDAFGNPLKSVWVWSQQSATLTLDTAGSYYLWMDPSRSRPARSGELQLALWSGASRTVQLQEAEPVVFEGSLDIGGQSSVFEFDVATSGSWLFKPEANFAGASWTLSGPNGSVSSGSMTGASDDARVLYLSAGHYRLQVKATGVQAGNFAVQAQPFAAAREIVAGEAVDLSALALGESAWLRVAANPGDGFELNQIGTLAGLSVRAFDAYAREWVNSRDANISFSQSAAEGAVYLLVTRTSLAAEAASSFTLVRNPAPQVTSDPVTAIAMGEAISVQPSSANSSTRYRVTLAEEGPLFVEMRTPAWGSVSILNASGQQVYSGSTGSYLYAQDGSAVSWLATAPWLGAGEYDIRFGGLDGQDFSFLLHSRSVAETVVIGTEQRLSMSDEQRLSLLNFEVEAGKSYVISGLAGLSVGNRFAVFDDAGNALISGYLDQIEQRSFKPAYAGRYTLAVFRGDAGGEAGAAEFGFTLAEQAAWENIEHAAGVLDLSRSMALEWQFSGFNQTYLARFELAEDALCWFDPAKGEQAHWRIVDQDGKEVWNGVAGSGEGYVFQPGIRHLAAGRYRLEAISNSSVVSDARFVISPSGSFRQIAPGISQDVGVVAQDESVLLKVPVAAGEELRLDLGSQADQFQIRVYDNYGSQIAANYADGFYSFPARAAGGDFYVVLTRTSQYDGGGDAAPMALMSGEGAASPVGDADNQAPTVVIAEVLADSTGETRQTIGIAQVTPTALPAATAGDTGSRSVSAQYQYFVSQPDLLFLDWAGSSSSFYLNHTQAPEGEVARNVWDGTQWGNATYY